jgi:nitronate monooxygenase
MWPDRRLIDLLQIDHPILQAPMASSATPELAAAVCNAGGMGALGCAEMTPDQIVDAVTFLCGRTNRPFNLNFFVGDAPVTDPAVLARTRDRLRPWYARLGLGEPPETLPELGPSFDDTRLALLLDLRPTVVSFHFGLPPMSALAALKSAGILILSTATTVAEALALEAAGIDAIIAQGYEAGGHRGSHQPTRPSQGVGTLALVPQIVDAVRLPVIAAGGIGDGRGIAAAFALGAAGVQMGTAFLSCPESGTDQTRRALLAKATETDTMFTAAFSGRSARAHRSAYAEAMEASDEPLPGFLQMYTLSGPMLAAGMDAVASFHLYGQAARLNRALPAGDLVALLVQETRKALSGLGRET